MCFSPEASFSVGVLTFAAGAFALRRMPAPSYAGLALMPVIFSMQQFLEGLIWIQFSIRALWIDPGVLAGIFIFIAQVVWPVFTPLAVRMAETSARRRLILAGVGAAGAGLSCFFLLMILLTTYVPVLENGRIAYQGQPAPDPGGFMPCLIGDGGMAPAIPQWVLVPYAALILTSFALSSAGELRLVGSFICLGLFLSLLAYRHALVSVWCFFAALASLLIVLAIERARRPLLP